MFFFVNLCRCKAGGAAAEFALVVPLFLTLFWGALEAGVALYSMNAMQFAANVAAREIALNTLEPDAAGARMQALLPAWMQGGMEVALVQSNVADPRLNVIQLRLDAPSSVAMPFSLLSRAHQWTFSVHADVRQELPYVD